MKFFKKWLALFVAIVLLAVIAVLCIVGISSINYYKGVAEDAISDKNEMETRWQEDVGPLTYCYVVNQSVRVGDEITEEVLTPVEIPDKVVYATREVETEVEVTDESGNVTGTETQASEERLLTVVTDLESVIGKKFRVDMLEGAILLEDYVMDEDLDNTARYYELVLERFPTDIQVGDYVDIRIQFTYSEDFVALPHKKVVDLDLNNSIFTFIMDEGEINSYNSMLLDKALYDSVIIYAIKYVDASAQTAAEAYYPVNANIAELIDVNPNILKLVETQMKLERAQLNKMLGGDLDTLDDNELGRLNGQIQAYRNQVAGNFSSAIRTRIQNEQSENAYSGW